jgi:EmrB/QacA subfamily drug resistance transporter
MVAWTPAEDGGFTHRQILTVIAGLMIAMFLAALDQTVVATAIRTIADDLQGYDLQAWATTAFLITSTISTPLYGKLSDIYGRRPFYLFAIGIFVVGSVLCGMADSMYQLAAFRAVQGIGAGGLMSLALAIIGDIVPPRRRSRYQGFFMAVFGVSSVLGPVIGGFLAGRGSLLGLDGWRWIFMVNVPLGLLAFAAVFRVLHLPHERREHRIDWPGALTLTTCVVPLLVVAERGRTWGWTSSSALLCYALAAVGLVLFLAAERAYGDDALLPLRLFRNRSFTVATAGSVVVGAGMFGGLLLLPQYLQIVHGSSATVAGLQMIPLVVGIAFGAMSSGIAISKTGRYRVFPLAGTVLMTGALVSLSFVVGAGTSIWALVPFMVLLGVGLGFNFQPAVLAVQAAVPPSEMGVATSSVTFFRQMGATIGTAAFLSVLFSRLPGSIDAAVTASAGADPRVAEAVGGGQLPTGGDLSDTSFIQDLPASLAVPFRTGFADSIDLVFLLAAGAAAVGFVVFQFLPQLTLSDKSGIQAAHQAAGDPHATDAGRAAAAAAPTSVPSATDRPGRAVPAAPRAVRTGPIRRRPLGDLGRARRLLAGAAALGVLLGVAGAVQVSKDRADGEAADATAAATGDADIPTPDGASPGLSGTTVLAAPTPPAASSPPEVQRATGGQTATPEGSSDTPLAQALPDTPSPTIPATPSGTTPPQPTTPAPTGDSAAMTTSTTATSPATPSAAGTSAGTTTPTPTSAAASPTTAAPTTAAPTTAEPTTAAPTTAAPTTAAPTTAAPTTAEPTTAAPTTAEPTTAEPTTAAPTTAAPTTAAPTTAAPTTAAPTTAAPTTAEPTTAAPTTAEPTTAESTTAP